MGRRIEDLSDIELLALAIEVIADGLPYDDAGVIELRLRSTNRAGTPPHSGRSALSGSEKDPTPEMLNAARREVAERHSTGS